MAGDRRVSCRQFGYLAFLIITSLFLNVTLVWSVIMEKDFDKWNKKKISIDSNKKYNHPKEKEVWWCSVGMNVGTEIYGKGDDYTRPVLIINAEIGEGFIGIPLTSKLKNGKYSCIIRFNDKLGTALVSQIRNFDKRRLTKKIGRVVERDYTKVLDYLLSLCKI